MLSREENDRLCRIGPGTPMGALFRRYWMPISLSERFPAPGCAPRAERLLGQDFVVFRGGDGNVGVLDELCMHRGASLALGRVEDCGIRCVYHGWKFGADGSVLEIMNLPADKRPPRLRAPAYPAVEAGGVIWVYLGPKEKQPPAPRFAYMDLPEENRVVLRVDGNYNWVQSAEGGLDSSHVSILHSNAARPGWKDTGAAQIGAMNDTGPALEIEDTEFGYHYAAFRRGAPGGPDNVRIVPFIMPCGRIIPGGALQGAENFTFVYETPIDDENTATYSVRYGSQPLTMEGRLREMGLDDPDYFDRRAGRLLLRRGDLRQKQGISDENWTGYRGIALEDVAIATSMHPIYDRSGEHLIASDLAVMRFRRRLLDAVDRMERGEEPIGIGADTNAIGAIDAARPASGHWRSLLPAHKVAGG